MMEGELTILLVDDDAAACHEISAYIDTIDDICLCDMTNNYETALALVQSTLPDAVILDLELHQGFGNGMFFLAGLNQLPLPKRPYVLITTNNSSTITHESARQLGADFIMAKYDANYSAQNAVELLRMMSGAILHQKNLISGNFRNESLEQKNKKLIQHIQQELYRIGINPKLIGYQYLRDAIFLTINSPASNLSMKLAEKYKKSVASIERAMQNAISRTWCTNDPDTLLQCYTARINSERGVPTTMEFVWYYASILGAQF